VISPCSVFDFHSVAAAGFLIVESMPVSWFFVIVSHVEFFVSQPPVFFVTNSYYDFFWLSIVDKLLQVKVGLVLSHLFKGSSFPRLNCSITVVP
jgi:hypothetical protein